MHVNHRRFLKVRGKEHNLFEINSEREERGGEGRGPRFILICVMIAPSIVFPSGA